VQVSDEAPRQMVVLGVMSALPVATSLKVWLPLIGIGPRPAAFLNGDATAIPTVRTPAA